MTAETSPLHPDQVSEPKLNSKTKQSKKTKDLEDPISSHTDEQKDGDNAEAIGVESSTAEGETRKKKDRKDKKKRRKHLEDGSADVESGTGTGTATPAELDGLNGIEVEKKKKKDKKRRKLESSSLSTPETPPDEPMQVDETAELSQEKKKKKRKHRSEEQSENGPSETQDEASEKTKKRKKTDPPLDQPLEATPNPDKKDKKGKKEKSKKDKKSKESQETPVETSSSSPSSSNPSTPPSEADIAAYLIQNSITIHSSSSPVIPVLNFSQLRVPNELQGALTGFKEPTPIQACSWPVALEGKDVVGIAETGSGKTLAFGIPALARFFSSEGDKTKPRVLVLAPTRELAIQTHDTLSSLGEPFDIRSVALFGGVDKSGQIQALRSSSGNGKKSKGSPGGNHNAKIIVGTPGRILDLVNDGICDLSGVDYLVLDEADRMLDKGFENDIRAIIGFTKPNTAGSGGGRQTLMFSATWPEAVRRLASSFLRDPVRVVVGSDDLSANRRVNQVVEVFDDSRSKDSRLLGHLQKNLPKKPKPTDPPTLILIFALYKKEAARVESMLRSKGYSVGGLHGDLSQPARMDALQKFKAGETKLLVATDVAARGLDIPNVELVVNYTFPLTVEDYIHRIGRTGRGGKHGKSITFFTGENQERGLAGELARVLRESGFESQAEGLRKFPMTIKKKTHSAYGAFFRDDIPAPSGPTKITFD